MKTTLRFKNIRRADFNDLPTELKNAKDIRYLIIEPNGDFTESIAGKAINTETSGGGTTTYIEMTQALIDAGTTTTPMVISPKLLKDNLDNKVSSVYKYKGSVATFNDLPTTNRNVGDVYDVQDTGMNYAWNGTEWDSLGMIVDLSIYATKTELTSGLNNKADSAHTHSKADIGLGDVQNYAIASQSEAEEGTSNEKYMTPLRTMQLMNKVMGDIESVLDSILGV